jgi:aspartate racemase
VIAERVIGIVGGVGPYAALDLAQKIFEETVARRDQDHLSVALLSYPGLIPDRTEFLVGQSDVNPALGMLEVLGDLERLGCRVVGIPCNTAHAPAIWDAITAGLAERGSAITLLHMVEEVATFIRDAFPSVRRVGVLSTVGTQRAGIYPAVLTRHGLQAITLPDAEHRRLVHDSVYDPDYGIKAQAIPVSERARSQVLSAITAARAAGSEVIVLACSELPLALPERAVQGTPLVDATRVLARAMVRSVAPERLRK